MIFLNFAGTAKFSFFKVLLKDEIHWLFLKTFYPLTAQLFNILSKNILRGKKNSIWEICQM